MKIKKKVTERKVVKKKVSKRNSIKRRNPESNSYQMGYEIGKEDIEQGQWELYDIYQAYAANICYLLETNEFTMAHVDYKQWMLGFIQAALDSGLEPVDKLKTIFIKIKIDRNYINPLLGDHSRVLQIIYQNTNTNSTIAEEVNQGRAYSDFIISNLLKFKYITKHLNRYVLTPKGVTIVKNIKQYRLEPSQYKLMKDVQDYLSEK